MKTKSRAPRGVGPDAVRVLPPVDIGLENSPEPMDSSPLPSVGRGPGRFAAITVMGALAFATLLFVLGDRAEDESSQAVSDLPPALPAPAGPSEVGRIIDATAAWAAAAGIPEGGSVRDLTSGEGWLVAVGSVGSRAAVWGSINGDGWRASSAVEVPAGSVSRINVAAEWGGEWIAFGTVDGDPAVWRAQDWRTWEFAGTPDGLSGIHEVVDIVAGADRFWLIASRGAGQALWISADGTTWTESGWGFGDEVVITAAAVGVEDGAWLYLAGSRCRETVCRPAVWRTQDGLPLIGATTPAGLPSAELTDAAGELTAINASATRIVAAGFTRSGLRELPAFWESPDGINWYPISDEASFPLAHTRLRLREVHDGDPDTVTIVVAGRPIHAAAGDAVVTEVGEVTIEKVEYPRAVLRFGSETYELGMGSFANLEVDRRIEHLAVQADRIIATGFEAGGKGANRVPQAWISIDGGDRWEVHRLPDTPSRLIVPGMRNQRMVVVAASGSSWVYDWDTKSAAAGAIDVFTRFIGAVNRSNLAGVIGSLSESRPTPQGVMELPGLIPMEWWDPADETLDPIAIAGALEYLDALDTAIALSDCEAAHRWDGTGRIRVECGYRLGSDFVSTMGLDVLPGRLSAMVGEGAVMSVVAPGATGPWQALDSWIRGSDPVAAESLFGSGEPGATSPPDASLAEAVLAAAQSYRSSFLQPGETIETATPAGTISWTLQDPFGQRPAFWLESAAGALWAMTEAGDDDWGSEPRLWRSEDGLHWDEFAGRTPGYWTEPMVFADRLVVYAQGESSYPLLSEWVGDRWVDIAIDAFPEEGEWWFNSVAESNGRVLIVAEGWAPSEDRSLGAAVWALTSAGRFERVALDGPDLSVGVSARLMAWAGGFALHLQANDSWGAAAGEVWTSPDGVAWKLASGELPLQGYLEWFGPLGDGLAARAYAGEECEQVGGESRCHPVWELWRSADGADWERDPLGDLKGYFELASGPAGTVAVAQGDMWWGPRPLPAEPISVLMASEDGPFEEIADLRVGLPFVELYWTSGMAFSSDTVIVSITGFYGLNYEGGAPGEESPIEQHWLLVGHLVEP